MIKDYFNCNIRNAILNEKEKNGKFSVIAPIDYRARKDEYEKFYTKEQLDYLFKHNIIQEYEPVGNILVYKKVIITNSLTMVGNFVFGTPVH